MLFCVSVIAQVPVGHPDEIDEIFDAISYSKGACVIRMLHEYIGDDVSDLDLAAAALLYTCTAGALQEHTMAFTCTV